MICDIYGDMVVIQDSYLISDCEMSLNSSNGYIKIADNSYNLSTFDFTINDNSLEEVPIFTSVNNLELVKMMCENKSGDMIGFSDCINIMGVDLSLISTKGSIMIFNESTNISDIKSITVGSGCVLYNSNNVDNASFYMTPGDVANGSVGIYDSERISNVSLTIFNEKSSTLIQKSGNVSNVVCSYDGDLTEEDGIIYGDVTCVLDSSNLSNINFDKIIGTEDSNHILLQDSSYCTNIGVGTITGTMTYREGINTNIDSETVVNE